MRIVRWFFGLLILLTIAAGVAYYAAGYMSGPAITINEPSVIGLGGTLDVTVDVPNGELSALDVRLEQKGREFPIFSLVSAAQGAVVKDGNRVRVTHPVGKTVLPELQSGTATIKVRAARPVLRGLRQLPAEASRVVQVRLTPPRLGIVSTHHYINMGGSEIVVYRVSPADVESGVRV